jgi:hypothetical protein
VPQLPLLEPGKPQLYPRPLRNIMPRRRTMGIVKPMNKIAADVKVAPAFPGLICQGSARPVPSICYHLINTPTPPIFIFKTLQIICIRGRPFSMCAYPWAHSLNRQASQAGKLPTVSPSATCWPASTIAWLATRPIEAPDLSCAACARPDRSQTADQFPVQRSILGLSRKGRPAGERVAHGPELCGVHGRIARCGDLL